MNSEYPSIVVLGNLTLDEISLGSARKVVPGGTAWYTSLTSAKLGANVAVVSRIGVDYPRKYLEWLKCNSINVGQVERLPGDSCRFALDYKGSSRTMQLVHLGRELGDQDVQGHWDGLHIGPVFNEVPISMIRDSKRHAEIVSMDIQGFVRKVRPDGAILLRPAKLGAALQFVDLLKATSQELLIQTGASRLDTAISQTLQNGPRWLVVTLGKAGAILAEKRGGKWRVPAYPELHLVDPTGAGDALVGGWLPTYVATRDPLWALCIGSALASMLVRKSDLRRFSWPYSELFRRAVRVHEMTRRLS